MIRFFLCLKGVIRKTDGKDIKISEIEPTLGFIESDTLKEYCQSFETSERNRLHVFSFSELAQQMRLKESPQINGE